jgi:hypothetical protein
MKVQVRVGLLELTVLTASVKALDIYLVAVSITNVVFVVPV